MNWLWSLAKRMDWKERFPRKFWRALLRWQDRRHSRYLSYDD